MKLRLGAAVLAAALLPLTTFLVPAPVSAGTVDTTPPTVGSCHALSWKQYMARTEAAPAVDCSARHTSLTVRVTQLETAPTSWDDVYADEYVPCLKDAVQATGGSAAKYQMTAYGVTFYRPTAAQIDAGAAWLRCDIVLIGGDEALAPVPQDTVIGGARPSADVRKCREGKRADYRLTVCTRPHKYVAYTTARMRNRSYPGEKAAKRFAARRCNDLIGGGGVFLYEWVTSRYSWRAGLRNAVCLPEDK
ncbi:septum formation family protein [Nocardioides sp. MH1]|uniref:septum formation family protein n=1 Tax=Nocardioides sp. MH1 TaxID=3242490 RepID=UPI00351FDEC9